VGGALQPEIFGQTDPAGAVGLTPSENNKSTTCFTMSLRWPSYVAPKPPKGGAKTQNGRFHFTLRKSAAKSLCVNTVRDKVVRHSWAYLSVQKWY